MLSFCDDGDKIWFFILFAENYTLLDLLLLSFCAKKVTKEGALRGELRFSPRYPPCKRPKRSTSLELPFRASTYVWDHSEVVCESNYVLLCIVVKFRKTILFFANSDFILGLAQTNTSTRRGRWLTAVPISPFILTLAVRRRE